MQEVEIKRELPEQDLNLKVKDEPYFDEYHFTMVKEEIQIKSEAIENKELDVPFNNDKYMMVKEEFSETRHITLVHEKNKPYRWTFECNVCSKRFGSKNEFYTHFAKVHDKNKPYHCSICFKVLGTKTTIREHIARVHDDKNKPYRWTFECNVCSKRFGSKSEFYRHFAKVHEKNKPYRWTFQCTICQSKFGSKSEFDRHFATVHDKNTPYGCSICFKVLDAKATVKEHLA